MLIISFLKCFIPLVSVKQFSPGSPISLWFLLYHPYLLPYPHIQCLQVIATINYLTTLNIYIQTKPISVLQLQTVAKYLQSESTQRP